MIFATRKVFRVRWPLSLCYMVYLNLNHLKERKTSPYYFQIETPHHHSYELVDPYGFQDEAYYAVHFVNSKPENLYKQLGAQLIELNLGKKKLNATRFAVFAPNASSVSLIGDMNQWDGRRHPMQCTECGHWVLVMPEVGAGVRYKFEIKDAFGNLLPHKADPLAFAAEQFPSACFAGVSITVSTSGRTAHGCKSGHFDPYHEVR